MNLNESLKLEGKTPPLLFLLLSGRNISPALQLLCVCSRTLLKGLDGDHHEKPVVLSLLKDVVHSSH